jgi:hypothetical protein
MMQYEELLRYNKKDFVCLQEGTFKNGHGKLICEITDGNVVSE